jgi:TATA-box binding protein (TBP) (component of TFIID and TFIIIB)
LVFSNGKINCNGKCESFKEVHERLRKYARLIHKLGWNVHLEYLTYPTASAVHELSNPIKLERIPDGSGFRYERREQSRIPYDVGTVEVYIRILVETANA